MRQSHGPAHDRGKEPPRSPRNARAIAFGILLALVTYGVLELTVSMALHPDVALPEEEMAADSLSTPDLHPGRERAGLGFRDPSMCLHPYLGYVFLPNEERAEPGPPQIAVSEDGFLDARPAVRQRAPGRLLVGITGGSVAGQLGTWHAKLLAEAFHELPRFRSMEMDFLWLGMPGYHQPQQLIQLSYILAQGGELDVLVNLDGFNEVAVPAVLNAPQGTHPLFPMNWSMVALDVPDTRVRRNIGAVEYLTRERYEHARHFRDSFWSFSPIARVLWRADDRKYERQIAQFAWELREFPAQEVPWFVRGPQKAHMPMESLIPECVAVWERCSRQMQALCAANGIRYLHVLQPNQYDPGSKPLSPAERESAFEADGPYRAAIEMGYPLLRLAGQRLLASEITFQDMSGIFSNVSETLYKDSCCHFNAEGNRLLARAIARAVDASL